MRIPLASSLKSRDGTLDQDAKVLNGIVEPDGDAAPTVRRRPGLTDLGLVRAGAAQLLYYWYSKVRTVIGDYIGYTNSPSELVLTTWNSADKDADVALSNGDLTITVSNGGFARSVLPCTSGSWAWQITVATATGRPVAGMSNSSSAFGLLGGDSNSIGYDSSGQVIKNSSVLTTVATYTVGDVVKVIYDADNATIAFYKNGTLVYTATGSNVPSGTLYAAAGSNSGGAVVHTANFDATSTAANLSPTSAGELFSAQDNGANSPEALLMIKNSTQAWAINTSDTVTQITDTDYPGTYAVTLTGTSPLTRSSTVATAQLPYDTNFQVGSTVTVSGATNGTSWNASFTIATVTPSNTVAGDEFAVTITRAGTTATATSIEEPHGFTTGQSVTIKGAEQSQYNGAFSITVTSPTVFTFTVPVESEAVTTPATGTIVMTTGQYQGTVSNNIGGDVTHFRFIGGQQADFCFVVGRTMNIISSSNSTGWVGNAVITAVSSNTFDFTVAGWDHVLGPEDGSGYISSGTHLAWWVTSHPTISSVTYDQNSGLATVTTGSAHYFRDMSSGNSGALYISGASPADYNGYVSGLKVTGATTFTYPIAGAASPATPATGAIFATKTPTTTGATLTFTVTNDNVAYTTPATGTIVLTSGRNTVPGIAYLNGYFVVMDEQGVIYNSALDDPENWNALEYTSALTEPGAGVAICKTGAYVAAMKEWSTEFFYDAANPTGSPLAPVENGFTLIGCADGWSVANVDGSTMWIAQSKKHKGRQIYRMVGTEQAAVSTPDVERVLNEDSLATVYAWGARIDGHPCYVLSLVASDVTLVYDTISQAWSQWSSYTLGASKSITSITRSGTTATVTFGAAHGLSDGDPLTISGATQTDYNGLFQVKYVSTTAVTIEVENSPVTPATGTILGYPYTETYLKWSHYTAADGVDVVLHVSDGHLYEIDPAEGLDDGVPVNYFVRTARLDGGATGLKKIGQLRVIGDSVADTAMVRWSDDDSGTFVKYRDVDLSDKEPELRRCGSFRRRSFEVRHVTDALPRLSELEIDVGGQ